MPSIGLNDNVAIIVIDFQNEFVRPGGKLHRDVKEMIGLTGMLKKVPHVINAARDVGALVIHAPVILRGEEKFDDGDWDPHAYGSVKNLFMESSWNCEIAEEVKPSESDVILTNRINFSAFRGTNLKQVIESNGITSLFVMGFLSNVDVEETTIEAKELFPDLKIYVCSDGCAAKSKQEHYVAMGNTLPMYADIITCSEAQSLIKMTAPSGESYRENAGDDDDDDERRALNARPTIELTYRPRILALHGAQSNNAVTKLQLANLNITDDDYDIQYLQGGVEVDEGHPDLDGLINGPFYSWFKKDDSASVIKAVWDVVNFCHTHGPFDGIYGFSSGAVVASLVANLARDSELRDILVLQHQPTHIRTVQDVAHLLHVDVTRPDVTQQQGHPTQQQGHPPASGTPMTQHLLNPPRPRRRTLYSEGTRHNLSQSNTSQASDSQPTQPTNLPRPRRRTLYSNGDVNRADVIEQGQPQISEPQTTQISPTSHPRPRRVSALSDDNRPDVTQQRQSQAGPARTQIPPNHPRPRRVSALNDDNRPEVPQRRPRRVSLLSDGNRPNATQQGQPQVSAPQRTPVSGNSPRPRRLTILADISDRLGNFGSSGGQNQPPAPQRAQIPANTPRPRRLSLLGDVARPDISHRRRSFYGGARPDVNHLRDHAQSLSQPLFKFVILACSAPDISSVREKAGYFQIGAGTIRAPSFHIIGIEDGFKAKSEKNASFYATREVRYMPGGHGVPRNVSLDKDLCAALRNFARTLGRPPRRERIPKYIQMNEVSGVQLLGESQVALVQLNHELLPEEAFLGGATIRAALGARAEDKPFIYTSRNKNFEQTTTYGDLLNFINGGAGDLRALDVHPGEVVAYAAPPGGSALGAVAFLSIGAQTAAAPLAPNTEEPDALDALDQFDAKHLILFDGVECPGVEAAFEKYAADGKAKIHRASALGSDKPGLFEFDVDKRTARLLVFGKPPLMNSDDGTCLLLRTSGTTARPKGVPLTQGDLITNGAIIAFAMQLTESDVCYSIMPLFHIGGISASILCTLTSGGAVSCDPEPFDPSRMVEALALSDPQPTWYSSVPTIHNATVNFLKNVAASDARFNRLGIDTDGVWAKGHSLRMIRSGAAALLGPDGEALAAAYGGVPIYPTYSMSEQMPISQPPAGRDDSFFSKPGAVGVPVAASTAIVSRGNLRPQPPGVEGEIAISGPTVLKSYLANPEANQKSFFFLSLAETDSQLPYFLTGDIGVIDSDGFLSLKGRAKELIKKGGEQVSPFEVEDPLKTHPWIQTPVCFAIPSKMYGEEVGCALVLSPSCPVNKDDDAALKRVSAEMRTWLKEAKLAPIKWPTKWILVDDDQLLKTATKKYIRVNLATHLGIDSEDDDDEIAVSRSTAKTKVDWEVIGAFRFVLACYVMFMHLGSNESWGAFNNLRGWPWHVHVFFTLGGYSMASPMNPTIQKKFSYFWSRIGSMYPMYAVALTFGLINLLIVCRPSTFRSDFHWDAQPDDLYLEDGSLAPLFCEGTPATRTSYWGSLFLTIFTYIFGLAITPFWPITWWLGYYLWFSSMYYCCLACFPVTYNYFFDKTRKNAKLLLIWLFGLLATNAAICTGAWFFWKNMQGYGHYEEDGPVPEEEYTDGVAQNVGVLSFYLFGPFWQIYFVIGMAAAFLYDAHRPAEKHSAHKWGWVADSISLVMISISVAIVAQGVQPYDGDLYMRPDAADQKIDSASSNRLWDNVAGRIFAPLTTLWIYALSTGEGFTAKILRWPFLAQTLAPNSYNCFLFHQMVGQWYYAATRNGIMWNWWRYRKDFYWFSPAPCPVEWYEYFYLVLLVVGFSSLMNTLQPIVSEGLSYIKGFFIAAEEGDDEDTAKLLTELIEGMTGIEPLLNYTLEECGLASIGVPVLVNLLNKNFSTKQRRLNITASDLVGANTIGEMVDVVDAVKALADHQGV